MIVLMEWYDDRFSIFDFHLNIRFFSIYALLKHVRVSIGFVIGFKVDHKQVLVQTLYLIPGKFQVDAKILNQNVQVPSTIIASGFKSAFSLKD